MLKKLTYIAILCTAFVEIVLSARYNVVGSTNEQQFIRLKSQYDLKQGTVLKLPIDVPQEYISLFGSLPPRLLSISSPSTDGIYGTGDVILIELKYTVDVDVSGIPTLTLNTGCHHPSCAISEIQSFTCAADNGMFGLKLENQYIMNIDVNTTMEQFRNKLQELVGINNVTVEYGDSMDRVYSKGNRICTSKGKNITVTFNNVTFPQYNGDVPPLVFDSTNYFPDSRSGHDLGEGNFLRGVNSGYLPRLSVSKEHRKGVQQRDNTAFYAYGSGTNTLTFAFIAADGDFTTDLEVLSINFDTGFIYSPYTGANVSTAVPEFGAGPRYMSMAATALGYKSELLVTSAQPQVISVTSPNLNAVYTEGDVIYIRVIYNLPVKLVGQHGFTLQLSTGAFDRKVPFYELVNNTELEFKYTIQQGDSSVRLDVMSSASMDLGSGNIYRKTSTNETIANITLPSPGTAGSLSVNKNLVVNTMSPQIITSVVTSPTGVYTGGDNIDIQVLYDNAIHVVGEPRLLIRNTPQVLNATIRTAPFLPEFTYSRAQPGSDTQILLSFTLNYALISGDVIVVHLPGFAVRDVVENVNRSLSITPLNGVLSDSHISGLWNEGKGVLYLTLGATLKMNTQLELLVNGQTGIFVPSNGVLQSDNGLHFDLVSSAAHHSQTEDFLFSSVGAVGFSSLSLTLSPAVVNALVDVKLDFVVPELLIVGDYISLFLNGFISNGTNIPRDFTSIAAPHFAYHWYPNMSEFRIEVVLDTNQLTHSIIVTQFVDLWLPLTGVDTDTVTLSAVMENNGNLEGIVIPSVTKVCAVSSDASLTRVEYTTKQPEATSGVYFQWSAGPTPLNVGDRVVFSLPAYSVALGTSSRSVSSRSVSGEFSDYFTVSIAGSEITFTCTQIIDASSVVSVLLNSAAGMVVPALGIRPLVDVYSVRIYSSSCTMSQSQLFYFDSSAGIISVVSPVLSLTPATDLRLGQSTAIGIQFGLYQDLLPGDLIVVTIPNFTRVASALNDSVHSNLNVSIDFHRRLEQLEFTVLSAFSAPLGNFVTSTPVYITLGDSMEFVLPTVGFSSSSFMLSIYSAASGSIVNEVMTSPCLGVCSGTATYSHAFKGQAVEVTFTMSLSHYIAAEKVVTFSMSRFILPTGSTLSVKYFASNSTTKARTVHSFDWTESNSTLRLNLPQAVAAQQSFSLKISGLQYSSDDSSPAPVVYVYDSDMNGTSSFEFSAPIVNEEYYLSMSNVTFSGTSESEPSSISFQLKLAASLSLSEGDFLDIKLPDFTNLNSLGTQLSKITSSYDIIAADVCTWDATNEVLRLVLASSWNATDDIIVTVDNFKLPSSGVYVEHVTSRYSPQPSSAPSSQPSYQPSRQPSGQPSRQPNGVPSAQPNMLPSSHPTSQPYMWPSSKPSSQPSRQPSGFPTRLPSSGPTSQPTSRPVGTTGAPTLSPSLAPSMAPSEVPSIAPSVSPTMRMPTSQPSAQPSSQPSVRPFNQPSSQPSGHPSRRPSSQPSSQPSKQPAMLPSMQPSTQPSTQPSSQPTEVAISVGSVAAIQYAIGLSGTDSLIAEQVTPFIDFASVEEVIFIMDASVKLAFSNHSSVLMLSKVNVSFTLSADMLVGDVIFVSLPYFLQTTPGVVRLTSSNVRSINSWDASASSLRLQMLDLVTPAGTVTFCVNGVKSHLALSGHGLISGTQSEISLYRGGTSLLASTNADLPCVGLCSFVISPAVRKAGYPTSYSVSISMGSVPFNEGDSISVHLPGFAKSTNSNYTAKVVDAVRSAQGTIELVWNTFTSTLSLSNLTSSSPFFVEMSFEIPQNFGLISPSAGVRDSDRFVANWTVTSLTADNTFSAPIVQVEPIGCVLQSSMLLTSDRVPGYGAGIAFAFVFRDAMSVGDTIHIYLPNYIVPSGAIDIANVTQKLTMVGVSALDEAQFNIDKSKYLVHHTANLVVTVHEAVAAMETVVFEVRTISGVYLPSSGVYRQSVPRFAVVSGTSPIASGIFGNFTRVGSMSPAHLTLVANQTNYESITTVPMIVTFTVNCPLFENDSITLSVPNLASRDAHSAINVNATGGSAQFNGTWLNDTRSIVLTLLNNSYILSGPLRLDIELVNFHVTNEIMYSNDARCVFSVQSTLCPVDAMPFSTSNSHLVTTSAVTFQAIAVPNQVTPVTLSFVSGIPIQSGDTIALLLPGFLMNSRTDNQSIAISSTNSAVPSHAAIREGQTALILELNFTSSIPRGQMVKFTAIVSSNNSGLIVPSSGVKKESSGVKLSLTRNRDQVMFHGPVQTVQSVSFFIDRGFVLHSQMPGGNTSFTLSWTVAYEMAVGTLIVFDMPGFARSSPYSPTSNSSVVFNGTASAYFSASWNPVTNKLQFMVVHAVIDTTAFTAHVSAINAFSNPPLGIPNSAYSFTITCLSSASAVLLEDSLDADITVVPHVISSSIAFISSEVDDTLVYGGDASILQLQPGHLLSVLDTGARVVIDGFHYTIRTVADNLLYLEEEYKGTRVFLESPAIPIYTPPFRYAYYHSGTGSAALLFRYKVRRGDLSSVVSVFNTSSISDYGNIIVTDSLDLNGGKLLRYSLSPAVVASIELPSLNIGSGRSVDTHIPQIIRFFSTSQSGMYSLGHKLDLHVQYDENVIIGPIHNDTAPPRLLLNVAPFGRVTAFYDSGSGTDTLVFVYTVAQYDDHAWLDERVLTVDAPIIQPLRIITNDYMVNLSRNAVAPLIHADVDFTSLTEIALPANISLVGASTKVVSMWVTDNSRLHSAHFTAGDIMSINIVFSSRVHVVTGNTSAVPSILINVGRSSPVRVFYASQYNATTLTFTYKVTVLDELPSGLYLHSTNVDYFGRTLITLNDSQILSNSLAASVVLTNSSRASELLIDSSLVIDNVVPTVVGISSNMSSEVDIHPRAVGDVALIDVTFTHPVMVTGILRLWLKGQASSCPARFYCGNNTNVLQFIYVVSYQSAVSRMDCSSVDSLDTSNGVVFRLSDNPVIIADTSLPRPGVALSLGLQSDVVIDTTPIRATSLVIHDEEGKVQLPYKVANSMGMNIYKNGVTGKYKFEIGGSSVLEPNITTPMARSLLNSAFENPLGLHVEEYFTESGARNYSRLIVYDQNQLPFRNSPLAGQTFDFGEGAVDHGITNGYWWTGFDLRSTLEIEVAFDRPVVHSNVSLSLNTGQQLNVARSVQESHEYVLNITYGADLGVQQTYRIEYGGYQTRCVSTRAATSGVSSLLNALNAIPSLRRLDPQVSQLTSLSLRASYLIRFMYLPVHELRVLTASQLASSCINPAQSHQVILTPNRTKVTFAYDIQEHNAILLRADRNVSSGAYSFALNAYNGVLIGGGGAEPDSMRLTHYDATGKALGRALMDSTPIPKSTRSSLSFSGIVPGAKTSINVALCFEGMLQIGDVLIVHLHNFNETYPNRFVAASYVSEKTHVNWTSIANALRFDVTTPTECVYETIAEKNAFLLPENLILLDDSRYTYSLSSKTLGTLRRVPFSDVSAVGVSEMSLSFSDPRPGYPTNLTLAFTTLAALYTSGVDDSRVSVSLPTGFHLNSYSRGAFEVIGDFSGYFTAVWENSTSTIEVRPLYNLEAGVYSLTLVGVDDALIMSYEGLSPSNPPLLSINSTNWWSYNNEIRAVPSIYGYDRESDLMLRVKSTTHVLNELEFSVILARAVHGPATLILYMPAATNSVGYYAAYNQSEYESVVWREQAKTLTFSSEFGWQAGPLSLVVSGMTDFTMNELGIPMYVDHGVFFAINGSDGFLPLSEIRTVTPIPMIRYSSVQIPALAKDVFTAFPLSIIIHLKLSVRAMQYQYFAFDIVGLPPMNASNAIILDDCALLSANTTSIRNHTLAITISNASHCSHQASEFTWIVSEKEASVDVRRISQYNTGGATVAWFNEFYDSGFQQVNSVTTFGLTSSAVDIAYPYAGEKSAVRLRVLTATNMLIGDVLMVRLQDFSFNWTSAVIYDNFKNKWIITYSQSTQYLTLKSTMLLQPTALKFEINGGLKPTLPSAGVSVESEGHNCTITMARNGLTLIPQAIQSVTPVGLIKSLTFKPIEVITRNEDSSSSSLISATSFSLDFETLSALNYGDVITIQAPHFVFVYNEILRLSEASKQSFSGRVVAASQVIEITKIVNDGSLSSHVDILPSNSIQKSSTVVCATDCPMSVSVASRSNPVLAAVVYASGAFIQRTSSSIRFYVTSLEPTYFPTFVPSVMPTNGTYVSQNPSKLPSSQPSASPSSQPTVQPSMQPSCQPSSSPTGVSRIPTFVPTTLPTSAYLGAFLAVDLVFTLQSPISVGSEIVIKAPILRTVQSGNHDMFVVANSVSLSASWGVVYSPQNQTIVLTALSEVSSGLQSFTVGANDVYMQNATILYQNSGLISYVVKSDNYVSQVGHFHTVHPYGLSDSSLAFDSVLAGRETAMTVAFVLDSSFAVGDMVVVSLPEFTKSNSSALYCEGSGASSVTAYWTASPPSLHFTLTAVVSSVNVSVPSINGLVIPESGSNNFTGLPTIRYIPVSTHQVYGPHVFNRHTPVSHVVSVNITFDSPRAGQLSDMTIELGRTMYLDTHDVLDFYLPNFWTTAHMLEVESSEGSFWAEWLPCRETLRLHAIDRIDLLDEVVFQVRGLRLPLLGVSTLLSSISTFSSNSTRGGALTSPLVALQTVGYMVHSSLSFTPSRLDQSVSLVLAFETNLVLSINETISISLPAVTISSARPHVSNNDSAFFAVWNSATNILQLMSTSLVPDFTRINIEISDTSIMLPRTGIPSKYDYTLSIVSQSGLVGPTSFQYLETVGVITAAIDYSILNARSAVGVRVQFQLSHALTVGDVIMFSLPVLTSVSPYADGIQQLVVTGDRVDDAFISPFNATFDGGRGELVLTALSDESAREMAVFIGTENNLFLSSERDRYDNQTHTMWGSVATMGSLQPVVVAHTPERFFVSTHNNVTVSNCTLVVGCDLEVQFSLFTALHEGDVLAISHPNLHRRKAPQTNSQAITISGSQDGYFSSSWRDADSIESSLLRLSQPSIGVFDGGYVNALSDFMVDGANLTLPMSSVSNVEIVSEIPQVIEVFAVSAYSTLVCGDKAFIHVRFSEPVMVFEPVTLKLLMSTQDFASYLSGNGTAEFVFLLNVQETGLNVDDLSVLGPGAMEYYAPTLVARLNRPSIVANLTVPSPYNMLLKRSGQYLSLSVNCDATTSATQVSAYSEKFKTYASGDVLDVAVTFARPITVVGKPSLLLQGLNGSSVPFIAHFANVSKIQWLEAAEDGLFALQYEDTLTACIMVSDVDALYDELISIESLKFALPLSIYPYGVSSGYRYKLVFSGPLAPYLLQTTALKCAHQVPVVVRIDSKMLNTVIFRYPVKAGDEAYLVTHANNSAILLNSSRDSIHLAGKASANVDLTLPASNGGYGLAVTSGVRFHTRTPYVNAVYSNQSQTTLTSGDVVFFVVNYTAPVTVTGNVYLQLNFSLVAPLLPTVDINGSYFLRNVSMFRHISNELHFKYDVQVGDQAHYLDTAGNMVNSDGGIYLAAMLSLTSASLVLPVPLSEDGLYASQVTVNGSGLPVIRTVFTNHSLVAVNAGEHVFITVRFSSIVNVVESSSSFVFVTLTSPSESYMNYSSGSGTTDIVFLYVPQTGHVAENVSFVFELNGAYLTDSVGHQFTYLPATRNKLYELVGLSVSAIPAEIVRIDVTEADGTYYPGDTLDIFVVFNKAVVVIGENAPSLQLFLRGQSGLELLATYSHGNGTTHIHFRYVIPPPNAYMLQLSPMQLDYGGTAAISKFLNGSLFLDVATTPTTEANVFLPILDQSNLFNDRKVYLDFSVARVVSVYSMNISGIYTAGDVLTFAVHYSRPVMVFVPPVLKLRTGAFNRSAIFVGGNFSDTLFFRYSIIEGDNATKLDYIDTRFAPYNTATPTFTLAMNTDFSAGLATAMDNNSLILSYVTRLGGVFMASRYEAIPALMHLPLPGTIGSLSYNSSIVIDTTAPYVTKVTTLIPDGTYGVGVVVPITVTFNAAVVVSGCPKILFRIGVNDKFALYLSGSGSKVLNFQYVIQGTDTTSEFDYFNQNSLRNDYCNVSQISYEASSGIPQVYFLRDSQLPTVSANLTMPFNKFVLSVLAPVSIAGSGSSLNLAAKNAYPRVVWTSVNSSRAFALGDVVDIQVGFSEGVVFPTDAYINVYDYSAGNESDDTVRRVYVTQQINATTVMFSLVVQANETFSWLSYVGQFSLVTSSPCSITEADSGDCAAQNLPIPFSSVYNSMDSLSNKHISSANVVVNIQSLTLRGVSNASLTAYEDYYHTGAVVTIAVQFSEPVLVFGTPLLSLYLNGALFSARYSSQTGESELEFTANVDSVDLTGALVCTRQSHIDLNGGRILRQANFLPLVSADLKLNDICCDDISCNLFSALVQNVPVVARVYSNQSGVFSVDEGLLLFVEFSSQVTVVGSPVLVLDLFDFPHASYVEKFADNTLLFRYLITESDYTSSLDYADTTSLLLVAPSTNVTRGLYDGIFLSGAVGNISANCTLPIRGGQGSLGRTSKLVVNKDRPNLIGAIAKPSQSTSGDNVLIVFKYSEAMQAVDNDGVSLFDEDSDNAASIMLNILIVPSAIGLAIESRVATLYSVSGTEVTFMYLVKGTDPSGSIYFASAAPLDFKNAFLKSIISATNGPTKLTASLVATALATIDNAIPIVSSVYTLNVSTVYAFGVGDIIDIFVEMSLSCVIYTVPKLALNLDNRDDAFAYYHANNVTDLSTTAVKTLHFKYTVMPGDSASPLEYKDNYALSGYLMRYSTTNPSIIANLTLPDVFSLGSLGYCCNVQIDSSQPYVSSLFPLKRIGIYGENETILILARFNKPVVVTGVPQLLLATGTDRVGIAYYTTNYAQYTDIPIDIKSTDVVFEYVVQRLDNILSLTHAGKHALVLNGSSILLMTNHPSTAADLLLRDPSDHDPVDGMVTRQWKFRYPHKVEVLVRDLYHTKADSLTVSVEHVGHSAAVFTNSLRGKVFGNNYPNTRTGTNVSRLAADTGIGSDYMFSDTVAPNIALRGVVSQSSTRITARRATDGNVDPLIGDNSVTETTEENSAWWQIALPANSTVRSVNIWVRKPQQWVDPLVEFTMKGLVSYPKGTFLLHFENIDVTDDTVTATSGRIQMGVTAEQLQIILAQVPGLGNVGVSRRMLPQCAPDGSGCGTNFEHGFGYVYQLDFQSLRVAVPTVTITDIKFVGQDIAQQILNGLILPTNVQFFQVNAHVDVIREGYYMEVSDVVEYGIGVTPPTSFSPTNEIRGDNEWLSPFYVSIYNTTSSPLTDLNASVNQSVWYQRFDLVDTMLSIVLPEAIVGATYIKIQREGYGSLSLAEVEIYSERLNTMAAYQGGSPVYPSYLTDPHQPAVPFTPTFSNVQFHGRWLVQMTQDYSVGSTFLGGNNPLGTVSEVVLIITDLAGIVHSYYQDLRAQIVALPKYGSLSYTVSATPHPFGDWREMFEVTSKGTLLPRLGLERSLGFCYGSGKAGVDAFETCPANYGVGPLLNNRVLGDTAEQNFLRGERVVVYLPFTDYKGPDYFTYIIHDGLNVQTHEYIDGTISPNNEVTVHVRDCRRFQSAVRNNVTSDIHPICTCAQSEDTMTSNRTLCNAIRQSLCSDSTDRSKFLSMCLTCFDAENGLTTGDCQLQTIRAVSLMTTRGLCSTKPAMDCSAETITGPGREKTNYLSLKPPTLYGSFSKLKNSFGAYGWYHTAQWT